jgi:hypothetical protein
MSKNPEERLKNFEEYLVKRSKRKNCSGFFTYAVQVVNLHEGTTLFFDSALAMKEGQWWYVLTEHNGNHWYCAEDVTVRLYRRVDRQEVEKTLKGA